MYGRVRRIELIKRIAIVVVSLIGIVLVAKTIVDLLAPGAKVAEFSLLKRYLNDKGFACEKLTNSGAVCKYNTDNVTESFIRYDKGFAYLYNNSNYVVEIYHVDGEDRIDFSTGDDSFSNYKNLKYNCSYKGNILTAVDECVLIDDKDVKLDNEAYIGIINKKIYEVNMMIEASGYNKYSLLNKYVWEKK
jgi:hypothetical protein